MRIFHHPNETLHDPTQFFRRGTLIAHPEQAARYHVLRDTATSAGHELIAAGDQGLQPILAIHDPGYVNFLRDVWTRRAEVPGIGDEVLTGHFARPHMHRAPQGMLGLVGYYLADTSTPVRAGTWQAVYASAQSAIAAADAALIDGQAYALCRPPGHHAYADSAGGFCYLNNTSIAAERLRQATNKRVAILDIDVHHGNGTQGIFYQRSDVLTVSIHADPANYFPFYAGYADETGEGDGDGFNRNFPLPLGSEDVPWLAAIQTALDMIAGQDLTWQSRGISQCVRQCQTLNGLVYCVYFEADDKAAKAQEAMRACFESARLVRMIGIFAPKTKPAQAAPPK